MPQTSLGSRLYFWPVYAAVARLLRYEAVPESAFRAALASLEKRFGASAVHEAVLEVCATNRDATPPTVQLRPKVRKLCFSLLGPAPEDEDWFYRHPDGTPRPRPERKLPDALARAPEPAPPVVERPAGRPKASRSKKQTVYQSVSEVVTNGTIPQAVEPTGEETLRSLKRQYRTLMKAYRMTAADSPARPAIKADIQALRKRIRESGGGTML